MKILHVDSTILAENSVTRRLTAALVEQQRRLHPRVAVTYRDLSTHPLPHLSGSYLTALAGAPSAHGPELSHDLALSEKVLEEFLDADVVVVGAPMYNFTIPTQLKAWLDRLAVPGKSFRYTEAGSHGLLGGKRIFIASARGGFYGEGSPLQTVEHQESYLNTMFGFFGITDIQYVRAEGVAISSEHRAEALQAALEHIVQLT